MKVEGHPNYHTIKVVMTDGTEYETRTTWGKEGDVMKLDIDPLSHAAWRGGTQKILEKGQLSKFEKRFGSFLTTSGKKEDETPAADTVKDEAQG